MLSRDAVTASWRSRYGTSRVGSFQIAVPLGRIQWSRTRRPSALDTHATVVGDSWTTRHSTAPFAVRTIVVPVTWYTAMRTATSGVFDTGSLSVLSADSGN